MNKLEAWIRIIRPPIVFISCLGVLVGALNTAAYLNKDLSIFQVLMVITGAAFLSSGLMIHNDVTDLKSDEINRPHKPLPQKVINTKTASLVGILLMFFSVLIAFLVNIKDQRNLNINCGFLTIIIVAIGLYYNHYGKYHGLFGNLAVALGVGAIPYWGSIAVFPNNLDVMFLLAFALFIQEIGREIMVNAGDYRGDLKAGFKTLPVIIGRKNSMYVALLFYIIFIPLYILPSIDWIGLGVPKVFGLLYLIGGGALAFSLLFTWFLTYRVVIKNDENKIWSAFEKFERTGTRVMIIVFQIVLLLEVFY
ncbi:MAG: UbiA family prenyltransferase [Candidatus Thermoplasmatota archaeon]|jgi:4-hydroxybenzoate polyprenyltransferase|nr:UbiA family prenyltransferase [Candidatus Thermoplasmatota archaeon]